MSKSLACIGIVILAFGYRSAAQPTPDDGRAESEATSVEGVDEPTAEQRILEDLLRRRRDTQPIEPSDEETPGPQQPAPPGAEPIRAPESDDSIQSPVVRKQGAFVLSRRGRILRSEDSASKLVLSFDADSTNLEDPPVFLMPCRQLESIEQTLRDRGEDTPFIVSGEIFTYRGEAYLLPRLVRPAENRGNLNP